MADIEIADQRMITVIAENREGRRNCDAEPYCQKQNDSLPFHGRTINTFWTAVNVKL